MGMCRRPKVSRIRPLRLEHTQKPSGGLRYRNEGAPTFWKHKPRPHSPHCCMPRSPSSAVVDGCHLGPAGPQTASPPQQRLLPLGPCLPYINRKEKPISRSALFWGMPRPQAPLLGICTVGWGWAGVGSPGKAHRGLAGVQAHFPPLEGTAGPRAWASGPSRWPFSGPQGQPAGARGGAVLAAAQHHGPGSCACSVPRTPGPR